MKNAILLMLATLATLALFGSLTAAAAQTNSPVAPPTLGGALTEARDALGLTNGLTITQTNWADISFATYDLTTKKIGGGDALLYAVTPNFWTGVRVQSINGRNTTDGVQAQLQVSVTEFGVTFTPFADTSVGLGSSSLYGSAGAGAFVNLHTWQVLNHDELSVGFVADVEHYVDGSLSGQQINAGPLIRFSW